MSKAVLLSIQPKWCALIASGKKTIEVRKTRPRFETPFKCYIYETKGKVELARGDDCDYKYQEGRGAVIGEFVCDDLCTYAHFGYANVLPRYMLRSPGGYPATEIHFASMQLSPAALEEYGMGKPLYGWHISDLVIYDKPRKLSEFATRKDCGGYIKWHGLTRPPQSWCYVEELEEEI